MLTSTQVGARWLPTAPRIALRMTALFSITWTTCPGPGHIAQDKPDASSKLFTGWWRWGLSLCPHWQHQTEYLPLHGLASENSYLADLGGRVSVQKRRRPGHLCW